MNQRKPSKKILKLLNDAINQHKNGEIIGAITLYKKVLRTSPANSDALHYLGLAIYQQGNIKAAINYIEKALVISPKYPEAMNNLGNIYKEMGDTKKAQALYEKVVNCFPNHVDALVNLAITERENKHISSAHEHLNKALELQPEHVEALHNIGNIYVDKKDSEAALLAYEKALKLRPSSHDSAKSLAHIYYEKGDKTKAIEILKTLLERAPDDAIAQHLLASFGGIDTPKRASDSFVKETFDKFSNSFDMALDRLQYKAPNLVAQKLIHCNSNKNQSLRVLDIGCGTGLCGVLIRDFTKELIGVDLSPNMLAKAKDRQVYDALIEAELTSYMLQCKQLFDFIICVDTFVYFGELAEAFSATNELLDEHGYFIFTLENHEPQKPLKQHGNKTDNDILNQNFILHTHGRYSHKREYVSLALNKSGLKLISIEDVTPRYENGEPVEGILVVAQKPSLVL